MNKHTNYKMVSSKMAFIGGHRHTHWFSALMYAAAMIFCLTIPTNVFGAHGAPFLDMTIDEVTVVLDWTDGAPFLGEDIPFGRTFETIDAITTFPTFRFPADAAPTGRAFSLSVTTPLRYWNHLDSEPSWGPTSNGEYMEIRDDGDLVAVITDGVSLDSPDAIPVPDHYVGGKKFLPLEIPETFVDTFILKPAGAGPTDFGGALGAYGFGMAIHLWDENLSGEVVEDFGWSEPFFLTFRNRPVGLSPPIGWMNAEQFVLAVAAGPDQLTVPEPSSVFMTLVAWLIAANSQRCSYPRTDIRSAITTRVPRKDRES